MTDIFVDSGSVGTPDGLTKTTAWLTLAAASGSSPGAGDRILISHTHSETGSSSVTLDFDGTPDQLVRAISIDFSDDSFTPGAALRLTGTADIIITGDDCQYEGVVLVSADDVIMQQADQNLRFIQCTLGSTSASGWVLVGTFNGQHLYFEECEWEFSVSSGALRISSTTDIEIVGGSLTNAVTEFVNFSNGVQFAWVNISSMDLTNATTIFGMVSGSGSAVVRGSVNQCKLNASYILAGGLSDRSFARFDMYNSETGTITAAAFKQEVHERSGRSITTTARYRTGGADDKQQANAVSQEMTALANRTTKRLTATSFRIGTYSVANGVSTAFKVHVAHNAVGSGTAGVLQDDEFWVALLGPSEKATSDAQGEYLTNRLSYNASASDLPTESGETWNGTNVGTKQSDSITYTPEIEGFVEVWVFFAPGGVSDVVVNVDPKIEVS